MYRFAVSALIFLFCRSLKGRIKAGSHRRLRCLSACWVKSKGAFYYCVGLK